MSRAEELQARLDSLHWYHSLDFGDGVVSNGACKTFLPTEDLPSFEGRSVLDIGAWDGYYSFLAEREGASRVVAMDDYVWAVDFARRNPYWEECSRKGVLPDHSLDRTEFWNPEMPGRASFDLAREMYGSKVQGVAGNFMTEADNLGTFDIVLFLGVLYHVRDPLVSLEAVRKLTGGVAVIETEALLVPDRAGWSAMEFTAGCYRGFDYSNWYTPTIDAIRELCLAAGFSKVEVINGPPDSLPPVATPTPHQESAPAAAGWQSDARRVRASLHRRLHYAIHGAEPTKPAAPLAPPRHYRALVHAYA